MTDDGDDGATVAQGDEADSDDTTRGSRPHGGDRGRSLGPAIGPLQFAPGALKFAALPVLAGIFLTPFYPPVGLGALVLGVAVLAFFRDPDRQPPQSGIVAPADGKVSVVREEGDRLRVGVFMNVTDVHVNRAPMAGYVEAVDHRPGAHRPAFTKDSDRNERVDLAFGTHEVSLIAGWFARRIHPYLRAGDEVERGERIGHVAFGSRADVLLPDWVEREHLRVEEGDKVRAGETVVAVRPRAEDADRE